MSTEQTSTEGSIREENENFNAANAEEQDMATATETPSTDNETTEQGEQPEEVEAAPQSYKDMTEAELKGLARDWNDERDLTHHDAAYIKIGQSKGELVEAFEKRDQRLDFFHESGIGVRQHTGTTLPADQIMVHPLNPRHEVDYVDPSFQDMLRAEGGIADAITVRESTETTEDGRTIYYALSGNRRLVNLKEVLDADGFDVSEYPVNVVIREAPEHEGLDESAIEMDELKLLVNANESAWDLSVVDKFNAMRDMEKRGAYQKDIAKEMGVSAPYVSNILKLRLVPEDVRDLVHYGHNADRFANMGVEMLERKDIPFHIDDKDNIVVHGIPWKNALEMAKLVAKYQDENELSEKEATKTMADFFLKGDAPWKYRTESGNGVLEAAQQLSQTAFRDWLKDSAINANLFEGKAKSSNLPKSRQSMDVEPSTDSGDEGGEDATATPASSESTDVDVKAEDGTVQVTNPETGEVDEFDLTDVVNDLSLGDYEFSDKWEKPLVDEVQIGNREAEIALRFLVQHGIIRPVSK
jgi:transcriptional regulator with XRE-family HTH domain